MTDTLQSFNFPLCPPTVQIKVSPEGSPVQITTNQGTYLWPDLYLGIAASGVTNLPGYITPYIGNVASGTLNGETFRTHAINTLLTFSGIISNVPSGVVVTSMNWNFGDGAIGTGNKVTHTYQFLVPSMQATLGVGFSNGQTVYTPKQMNLTAS